MTAEDAKRCLFSRCSIVFCGARYEKITAIMYRLDESGKNIIVSAELLDKSRNSVVIANLKDICEYKGN